MTTPFPHDFSEVRYCKALKELFKPGTGTRPPTLAGRDTEKEFASDVLLGPLADGHDPAADLVLFGPRGNGKTVLLKDLERRAGGAGIGVLALRPAQLDSLEVLLRTLLQAAPTLPDPAVPNRWLSRWKNPLRRGGLVLERLRVGAPGLRADLSAISDDELKVHAQHYLSARCRAQPLLVTVDEAHTLDIEIGRRLLNLSEQLRADGVPFVLILAGTPNLEAHLGEMIATFWDRSEILPIGRLSTAATAQALTEPLAGYSVSIEPDALAAVVADSQCYPYFIQLWGRALCGALVEQAHSHTVTAALVEQVAERVAARRERYYGRRYLELKKQGLLEAAAHVATPFKGTARVHEATLEATLVEDLGLDAEAAEDALGQLADLGYTWAPAGGRTIEPGIPSLMSHVRDAVAEEMEATPARPRP